MTTIRVTFYDPASGERRIEDFSGYDHEDSSEVFGELCKAAYKKAFEERETIESIVPQNNWLENFDELFK